MSSFDAPRVHAGPLSGSPPPFYQSQGPADEAGSSSVGSGSGWSNSNAWTSSSKQQQQQHQHSGSSLSSSSLLSDVAVPDLYQRLWVASEPQSGSVSLGSLQKIVSAGGIKYSLVEKIISLVAKSSRITKQEFFCAVALLALAQSGRDVSIEAVAATRDSLPLPNLPTSFERAPDTRPTFTARSASETSIDPWSSGGSRAGGGSTTGGGGQNNFVSSSTPIGYSLAEEDDSFGENLVQGGLGYGAEGWALGAQDRCEVTQREELGGSWVMKHTVWVVRSTKHGGSMVERRYSDFVWLLDCLTRRYPFRLLPSLPPKRVAISGRYLAADDLFLERRRAGLARFLTFAVNHPTLKHDAILQTFLTLPSDLHSWRAQAHLSLDEEATQRQLTPSEEMSIPADLDTKLMAVRGRIIALVDAWTAIASLVDRIAHRRQNEGADLCRLQVALNAGLETERSGWRTVEVETVEADQESFAAGVGKVGEIVERSANRTLNESVEEVKRHRELYLNYRDLIARQALLSNDAVDKLKKRVETSLRKAETVREVKKPGYEVELDKVASSVEADQRQIDLLLRRRVFIRFCMWQETLFLFRSTSLLRGGLATWARSEREFGAALAEEWERTERLLGR